MRFEMIGVQFDQAGHDQIAACILAAARRVAVADFSDTAIGDRDPASIDHAIRKNNPGVADDGFGYCIHLERSSFMQRDLHAAAANDVTSTIRSAIKWRISSSCTIATMATPSRFF